VQQNILPGDVFRLCEDASMQRFTDGALVLQMHDRHLYEVNTTAGDLIERLDGKNSLAQIAASMAKEYSISAQAIMADLIELIQKFIECGLIEKSPTLP
jgi:hypothetical protein